MPRTLEDFVKDKLSAAAFEKLHETTNISKTKLTRIFNNPKDATKDEVIAFSKVLGITMSTLVDDFKMGYNTLTLDEYSEIICQD